LGTSPSNSQRWKSSAIELIKGVSFPGPSGTKKAGLDRQKHFVRGFVRRIPRGSPIAYFATGKNQRGPGRQSGSPKAVAGPTLFRQGGHSAATKNAICPGGGDESSPPFALGGENRSKRPGSRATTGKKSRRGGGGRRFVEKNRQNPWVFGLGQARGGWGRAFGGFFRLPRGRPALHHRGQPATWSTGRDGGARGGCCGKPILISGCKDGGETPRGKTGKKPNFLKKKTFAGEIGIYGQGQIARKPCRLFLFSEQTAQFENRWGSGCYFSF